MFKKEHNKKLLIIRKEINNINEEINELINKKSELIKKEKEICKNYSEIKKEYIEKYFKNVEKHKLYGYKVRIQLIDFSKKSRLYRICLYNDEGALQFYFDKRFNLIDENNVIHNFRNSILYLTGYKPLEPLSKGKYKFKAAICMLKEALDDNFDKKEHNIVDVVLTEGIFKLNGKVFSVNYWFYCPDDLKYKKVHVFDGNNYVGYYPICDTENIVTINNRHFIFLNNYILT